MPIQHPVESCLIIKPRDTDYVLGDGHLSLTSVLPSGDWTPYFDFFERQMLQTGDTNGCVLFTAQEVFDAQIEQQIQAGIISDTTISFFNRLGFMDEGTDGKMHFHSSPRFLQILTGNGLNGNNIYDAWDVMRKYGVLPYKDLPVDPTMIPQDYVNPKAITQAMKDKAIQFLIGIGGKQSIQYHWILNNTHNFPATIPALQHSPLCDGVNVGNNWNSTTPPAPTPDLPPGHCVARIKDVLPLTAREYDHYIPAIKDLVNYPIAYSLQAIVTVTPPPPAPLPPVVSDPATPVQVQATQNWILTFLKWLFNIQSSVGKVENLSSNTMSQILSLNWKDLGKGGLTAVFTAVVLALGTAVNSGNFDFFSYDWVSLGKLAVGAGIGYLIKNLLSDHQGNFLGIGSKPITDVVPPPAPTA